MEIMAIFFGISAIFLFTMLVYRLLFTDRDCLGVGGLFSISMLLFFFTYAIVATKGQ